MAKYSENYANTEGQSQRHRPKQLHTDNIPPQRGYVSQESIVIEFQDTWRQRTLSDRTKRSESRKLRNQEAIVDRQSSIPG